MGTRSLEEVASAGRGKLRSKKEVAMPRKEKVIKVIDGDTFLTNRRKHPVRLSEVDTPEKRQPGYQEAKQALADMILGQEVTIDTQARDTYHRSVAKVKLGSQLVNNAMKKYQK